MALRVFVTRELFPFTAGGIGRVVANILATSSPDECAKTAIVFVGDAIDQHAFHAVYPGVRFIAAGERDYACTDEDGRVYPPKHAFSSSWLQWESVLVLQALLTLERRDGQLGYVEFVDWGAAGFAATQEKRLGRAFQNTVLAVRLHTTDSVLAAYEKRNADVHGLAVYDLERKALADCDVIVGQLAPVAEAMRKFYDFREEDWCERVVLHAPPVLLDAVPIAVQSVKFGADTPLVFSSKLQDIKRPDVFVRACVEFMLAHPTYKGEARFLAHAFDPAYQARIERLVPKELAKRFVFLRNVSGLAREKIIAASICIFPSPWESFCLAAYEASLSGALCIVNGANPAFGEGTPWVEAENCHKFDGTASGLAEALAAAFACAKHSRNRPVTPPADSAPWNKTLDSSDEPFNPDELAVVVLHHGDPSGLLATLDSIVASSCVPSSLIVVDDASRDALSEQLLARLESHGAAVQMVRLPDRRGAGAALNAALDQITAPLVAVVSAGSVVAPEFLESAVVGLARNPDFDIATGQQGYGLSLEDVASSRGQDLWRYWVVHGEARAIGHIQNRYAADAFVVRASRARSTKFNDALGGRGPWEFFLSCVSQGARCLVMPWIAVVRRADALVDDEAGRHPWRVPVAYVDLLGDKHLGYGGMRLPAHAFALGGAGIPPAPTGDEYHRLYTELRSSETVRTALFIAETLQRRAPWLLAALRHLMLLAVRVRRR